jgi:hypothetical protein
MKSIISILAVSAMLAATTASAQAPWVEDTSKSMRIGLKPDFAEADSFRSMVTVRRDGSQRDSLVQGELSQPGPVAWVTYQSAPMHITFGGNAIDGVTTLVLRGASFSHENRQSYSVTTAWGSADVTQAAGVLGDGSKRECAIWRQEAESSRHLFWGYVCGAVDQPLDANRVRAALNAVASE